MKTQRIIFYCLLMALVTYGFNYHIGKAFIHLATLLSVFNIFIALKSRSLLNISSHKSTLVLSALLATSAVLTLIYYKLFNNHMSERHFLNMFYPALFFSIILPSLTVERRDKYPILFTAIISSIIMAASGIVDYISADNPGFRTSGFLNLPIIYASCMVLMTCWLAAILLTSLTQKKWIIAGICIIAVISAFTAVLFTGSRGPIIATIVVLLALIAHYLISNSSVTQKVFTITIILAVSMLSLALFPQSKLDNIKNRFQVGIQNVTNGFEGERRKLTSAGIRLDMWEASLVAVADNPLTGIGPGNHTTYFPMLEKEGRININTAPIIKFDHMHNDYIQAWLSMGVIFGTLSIAFILYFLVLFTLKPINTSRSLAGLSVCSSFILCGLTDVPAHNAASLTLFLIITSLQLSYLQSQLNSKLNSNSCDQN
jgi:O-antigen ligase